MADTKRYQLVGGLTPDSRPDRAEIGAVTLEVGGEPKRLSEAQATRLRKHVELREIPDGVTAAEFGPSIEDQLQAASGARKTSGGSS